MKGTERKKGQKSIRLTMSDESYEKIQILRKESLTLGKSLVLLCLEEVNKLMKNLRQ